MKKFLLHLIFLIIVAGDLTGEFLQVSWIDYLFKPLIMVWIGGYFLFNSRNIDSTVVKFATGAFVFSWIGDILLMFTNMGQLFFMLGLGSFLVAQVFYIFLFLQTINLSGKKPFLKKSPFWLIAYMAYGLIFYIVLYNHLEGVLTIAVLLYMVAIMAMSATALNRFGNGHPVSFSLVFTGSILFIVSDSMIAINKFMAPIPYEGLLIMSTYICAQFLIMKGLLKQYEV